MLFKQVSERIEVFRRARSVIEDDTEYTQVYEYWLNEQRQSNAKKEQVYGGLAQLGERLLCTQEVKSSILLISTNPQNAEECTLTTE